MPKRKSITDNITIKNSVITLMFAVLCICLVCCDANDIVIQDEYIPQENKTEKSIKQISFPQFVFPLEVIKEEFREFTKGFGRKEIWLDEYYFVYTLEEIKQFIIEDDLDQTPRKITYDCDDFAFEFMVRARAAMPGCALGVLIYNKHALNIFYCVHTSQFYLIEPQNDAIVYDVEFDGSIRIIL